MTRTTTIGIIDGNSSDQRLELSLNQSSDGSLQLGLSEQHFADGIGWFTQRSLSLNPSQISQLKRLLGIQNAGSLLPEIKDCNRQTLKLAARPAEDHTFSEVG